MPQDKIRSFPLSPCFPIFSSTSGSQAPAWERIALEAPASVSSIPLLLLLLLFSTAGPCARTRSASTWNGGPSQGWGRLRLLKHPEPGVEHLEPSASEPGAPGKTWTDPVTGMAFVWVPGGMLPDGVWELDDNCDRYEKPVHEVCLDGFWMGKYEVSAGD